MKKNIIFYTFFFGIILNTNSQVTIGMGEAPIPGVLLQLKENSVTDDGPNSTKGLGFPRVSLTHKGDLRPMFSSNTTSEQKLTHTGLVVYNTNTAVATDDNSFMFKKGLYVWSGAGWETLDPSVAGGSRWAVTAERATQPLTDDHKDPVYRPGSVTIGKDDVHTSDAILNIAATDKGVLLPRVALTSPTDKTTIPNPSTGLLVYNTGTEALKTKGYMYWSGTEWNLISYLPSVAPQISNVFCERAELNPSYFYDNNKTAANQAEYTGILKVPYDGGNGGWYNKGTSFSTNGLTLVLQSGQLSNGVGELVFSVKGKPTSNQFISPINSQTVYFYNNSCNATIESERNAEIRSIATMGPLEYTSESNQGGYGRTLTTPDRKFSVRIFVPTGTTFNNADIQIRNNQNQSVDIMWSSLYGWESGSNGASGNTLVLPSRQWAGNGTGKSGENTVLVSSNKDASWGDPDVYAYNKPEQRSFMWTSKNTSDKVFYHMVFMMGAQDLGAANASRAASSKAFLKIDQIRALD